MTHHTVPRHLMRTAALNIKHRLQQTGCEDLYRALLRAYPYDRDGYCNEWQNTVDAIMGIHSETTDENKLTDWNTGTPLVVADDHTPLWDGTPLTPEHVRTRKPRR